jgi:addiction module HigA family antidote
MNRVKTHPGKALLDEMLERNWNHVELAIAVGMEPGFVRELLMEHEDVTPEVAAKLSILGPEAKYWLNLQQHFNQVGEVTFSLTGQPGE